MRTARRQEDRAPRMRVTRRLRCGRGTRALVLGRPAPLGCGDPTAGAGTSRTRSEAGPRRRRAV